MRLPFVLSVLVLILVVSTPALAQREEGADADDSDNRARPARRVHLGPDAQPLALAEPYIASVLDAEGKVAEGNEARATYVNAPHRPSVRRDGDLAPADVNLALHKRVRITGETKGQGRRLTDGQLATGVQGLSAEAAQNEDLMYKVNLGENRTVTRVVLRPHANGRALTEYRVVLQCDPKEVPEDGSDPCPNGKVPWKTRKQVASGEAYEFSADVNASGRWVRVETTAGTPRALPLSEIEIWGPEE